MPRAHFEIRSEQGKEFIKVCQSAGYSASQVLQQYVEIELEHRPFTSIPNEGTRKKAIIAENSRKRAEEIVQRRVRVLKRVASGDKYADIAADEGITVSGVSRIVTRWKDR